MYGDVPPNDDDEYAPSDSPDPYSQQSPPSAPPPPPTHNAPPPNIPAPTPQRRPPIPRRDEPIHSNYHYPSANYSTAPPSFPERKHSYSSDSYSCPTEGTSQPSYGNDSKHHTRPPSTDPYDLFKRFFGTRDLRQAASMGDSFSFFDKPPARSSTEPAASTPQPEPAELITDPPITRTVLCSREDL